MPKAVAPLRRHRLQVRATPGDGPGTFAAVVSTYNTAYEIGWGWTEMILEGCFADSIDAQDGVIPIFYTHDWPGGPIGVSTDIEETTELTVRGKLYLDLAERVAVLYQAMLDNALREWSIGFWPESITSDKDHPLCDQIAKGDLAESSLCVRGANPDTGTAELNHRDQCGWIDGNEAEQRKEVTRLRKLYAVPDLGRRRHADPPATRDDSETATIVEQIDALVDELLDLLGLPDDDDVATDGKRRPAARKLIAGVLRSVAPQLNASGHTHQHKHGSTVHSHSHTHGKGNYDHNESDLEVVHDHAHADDEDDDITLDAARVNELMGTPWGRKMLAELRASQKVPA
ncbi:MAG: hypothetical protein QOK39_101 [Acidimicrobiaceae bacterium]|jgi:HK97 family phage prohead protease|nr:hypothetical protein [Acidimicrobiaceae bacterium]